MRSLCVFIIVTLRLCRGNIEGLHTMKQGTCHVNSEIIETLVYLVENIPLFVEKSPIQRKT